MQDILMKKGQWNIMVKQLNFVNNFEIKEDSNN